MTKQNPSHKQPYHHGGLREALIATAEEIVREGGSAGLTLREAARRAGVSHNAPYSHFEGKLDLLAEVAARGFERLANELDSSVAQAGSDTVQALLNVGRTYVEFGLKDHGVFRLMFGVDLAEFRGSARLDAATQSAFAVLEKVLAEGAAAGLFKSSENASLASWALMHGLVLLMLDRRAGLPREPEAAAVMASKIGALLVEGIAKA